MIVWMANYRLVNGRVMANGRLMSRYRLLNDCRKTVNGTKIEKER